MPEEKSAKIIDISVQRTAPEELTCGEYLAHQRMATGMGLAEIARSTKIKVELLQAIENADFAALPATPYSVGFVKTYARFLNLDDAALGAQFKTEMNDGAPDEDASAPISYTVDQDERGAPPIGPILGIIGVIGFVIWVAFQIAGHSTRDDQGAATAVGTIRLGVDSAPAPQPRTVIAPDAINASTGAEADTVTAIESPQLPAPALETISQTVGPKAGVEDQTALSVDDLVFPEDADEIPVEVEAATPPLSDSTDDLNSIQAAQFQSSPAQSDPLPPAPLSEDESLEGVVGEAETEQEVPLGSLNVLSLPDPGEITNDSVEDVVVAARLVRSASPRYPARCARNAGPQESVTVVFDVNAVGSAINARAISSTDACFEREALRAVSRWRFDPRTVNGSPRPEIGREAAIRFDR